MLTHAPSLHSQSETVSKQAKEHLPMAASFLFTSAYSTWNQKLNENFNVIQSSNVVYKLNYIVPFLKPNVCQPKTVNCCTAIASAKSV